MAVLIAVARAITGISDAYKYQPTRTQEGEANTYHSTLDQELIQT